MTNIPPLLPEHTFARVMRLARLDGMSVLAIAGFFALLAALGGDFTGAIVGLAVAGAGAVELHGTTLLHHGEARGMRWLVGSQLLLLASILIYCAVRLSHLEIPPVPDAFAPMIDLPAKRLGLTRLEYLELGQRIVLWTVATVSFFYQGAMALYYHRRRHAVARALEAE